MEEQKKYMNVKQIAEYLEEANIKKIYRWVRENKIPHLMAGTRLLFEKQAIDDWLQKTKKPDCEGEP